MSGYPAQRTSGSLMPLRARRVGGERAVGEYARFHYSTQCTARRAWHEAPPWRIAYWVLAVPMLDKAVYSIIRSKLVDAFGGLFEEVIVGGAPLNKEVEDFLYRIKFPFTG